jgi:hypothetical protein
MEIIYNNKIYYIILKYEIQNKNIIISNTYLLL